MQLWRWEIIIDSQFIECLVNYWQLQHFVWPSIKKVWEAILWIFEVINQSWGNMGKQEILVVWMVCVYLYGMGWIYWECAGSILVYWRYGMDILRVCRKYTKGTWIYWVCKKYTKGIEWIYWECAGSILKGYTEDMEWIYWECAGSILKVLNGYTECMQEVY